MMFALWLWCAILWKVSTSVHGATVRGSSTYQTISHPAYPQYLVRMMEPGPICDSTVKQMSGYLDIQNDKHFFFWFFESRNDPKNDPVVLWLNGGPGCSSMTGLLLELGPCLVLPEGNATRYNPHSWNNNASIIFLDQPLNVGYSYGADEVSDSKSAAKDINAFLQLFFTNFPEYRERDFHIAGESYAGHYIPAVATVITENNKKMPGHEIRLRSLLIGNGLTDPLTQYAYYSKMACNSSYGAVLPQSVCTEMDSKYPACARLIQECYDSGLTSACTAAGRQCNNVFLRPFYDISGRDPYDLRKQCASVGDDLCNELLGSTQTYLNRPEVKQALGVQTEKVNRYVNCNNRVNVKFSMAGDWMRPYVQDIRPLLESGIRVLIYAGDADFICNWMGNKAWTLALPWSGHDEFNMAPDLPWSVDGEPAGEVRAAHDGLFTFLRVYGAGHMVPFDQPKNAVNFFNRWIKSEPLSDAV